MRFGACLLLPFLTWAQPALPLGAAVVIDVGGPCFAPEGPFETLISQIEKRGWQATQRPEDALIEDLAWIHAVIYLNSDTGGESTANILEIQRKAARGLMRKKDIPQSKSRFFHNETSEVAETLMFAWRKPKENVLQVDCRYSIRNKTESSQHNEASPSMITSDHVRIGDTRVQRYSFNPINFPGEEPPAVVIHTEHMTVSQ